MQFTQPIPYIENHSLIYKKRRTFGYFSLFRYTLLRQFNFIILYLYIYGVHIQDCRYRRGAPLRRLLHFLRKEGTPCGRKPQGLHIIFE